MKRIGTLVLAATLCAAALTTGTAYAGAAEGSWYFAPQVNALWLDDGRVADDDVGITLSLGYVLSEKWDTEFTVYASDHDRANDVTLELQGYGMSLHRVFYSEGRVNPYLTLGLPQTKTIPQPGADDTVMSALYGAGLLIDLGAP